MDPVAEKLLEQHIHFELQALTGKDLQPYLRSEVKRGFDIAGELTLRDCATEKRCVGAFKRLLVKPKIPKTAVAFLVSLWLCAARRFEQEPLQLQAVIERDHFLELIQLSTSLQGYRSRLIADLVKHPLYRDMISSLVYQALVNYLVDDNLLSQRVPGVGSMLKLGRKVANRALPDLDSRLEKQLRTYIEGYLPALLGASEQFLDSVLSDSALLDRLADAWPQLGSQQLSGFFDGVEAQEVERFGDWGKRYWETLRQSDDFVALGETLIAQVYDSYGDRPLAVLLGDLGITRSLLSNEITAFAPPLARQLRESGYLQEFLRDRLTPFYASREVAEILRTAGQSR